VVSLASTGQLNTAPRAASPLFRGPRMEAMMPRVTGDRTNLPPAAPAAGTRVVLASTSPRRRHLLHEAGIAHEAMHPGVDDGVLSPTDGMSPEQWAAAMAYYKAASAARARRAIAARSVLDANAALSGSRPAAGQAAPSDHSTIILAADTVVAHRGRLIGQPKNLDDAAAILSALDNDVHDVVTGVALLDPVTGRRDIFTDRATVRVGAIGGERLGEYLASGDWRGKAGAYNLSERLAAGWPIEFDGDPGTIMGLPVRKLLSRLATFQEPRGTSAA
jgi:septum formation protein